MPVNIDGNRLVSWMHRIEELKKSAYVLATPMSASCSAGASLRPSPVIATTWQRAGLVSADEGRRAEGLDRFETTDQCAACRHLPGTHRQRQADRREQALGYERHRDAEGNRNASVS